MSMWKTAAGETIALEDMSDTHLQNCIRMLQTKVGEMYRAARRNLDTPFRAQLLDRTVQSVSIDIIGIVEQHGVVKGTDALLPVHEDMSELLRRRGKPVPNIVKESRFLK